MSPVQRDGCAWRPSQSFEILGDILQGTVADHLAYESTNGFFALRTF